MGGGVVVIRRPDNDASELPVLAGNTCLYGATGGELFVAGGVGERFAVRNSGAIAVVESAGDHCCEYMTGGTVVVLGSVGWNLGAGMTGGQAFVFDRDHERLISRLNPDLVDAVRPDTAGVEEVRWLVERHAELTGSPRSAMLLEHWAKAVTHLWHVLPKDQVRRYEESQAGPRRHGLNRHPSAASCGPARPDAVDSGVVMAGSAPHIPGCRGLSLIGERVARSLYSAYSESAGRQVTVTVFPPLSEGRTRDGFDEAAATAQRLGAHPSVLTIHDWGHAADGRPWIVTDPQPAESVDQLLTLDGPLEVERALQVGVLLAGALETAHRAGIVHGDLQPARLVFGTQGEPLLVETGLASFAVFPGLGALNNPVRYHAPPEVLERTEVTAATDVYSLATTVYALISGRAPHQKPAEVTDSNASLLLRILQMPVPRIDRPGLPAGLDDALGGPLSASPGKRPQQAIEVAWLLQDVQRRNGMAVTEPVVLELDGIAGRRVSAPSTPPVAPVPDEVAWSEPVPDAPAGASNGAGVDHAWATDLPDAPDPWAPDAEVPPPTIFPFAEGLPGGLSMPSGAPSGAVPDAPGVDDPYAAPAGHDPFAPPADAAETPASPWAAGGETGSGVADGGALWPSTWPADTPPDEAPGSLWPSSWPAEQPAGDLPAWASTPLAGGRADGDDEADEPRGAHFGPAQGGDGGSIDDVAGLTGAAAAHGAPSGAGSFPDLGAIDRPPELDELPAWFTDPLPNQPGGAAWPDSPAAPPASGAPAAPWADPPDAGAPTAPWADPPGNGAPTAPWADRPDAGAPSAPWAQPPGNGGPQAADTGAPAPRTRTGRPGPPMVAPAGTTPTSPTRTAGTAAVLLRPRRRPTRGRGPTSPRARRPTACRAPATSSARSSARSSAVTATGRRRTRPAPTPCRSPRAARPPLPTTIRWARRRRARRSTSASSTVRSARLRTFRPARPTRPTPARRPHRTHASSRPGCPAGARRRRGCPRRSGATPTSRPSRVSTPAPRRGAPGRRRARSHPSPCRRGAPGPPRPAPGRPHCR